MAVCQVAHALVVPVSEVLLIPVGVDLRPHAKFAGYRGTRLDCAVQARGDHSRRCVADERTDSLGSGTGLTPAPGIQKRVRTSPPVKLARNGEVGDTMAHQHDPRGLARVRVQDNVRAGGAAGPLHGRAVHGRVGQRIGGRVLSARDPAVGHRPPAAVRAAATSRATSARRRRSGALIFQRPVICSTRSLESSRTETSAPGSMSKAAVNPATKPEYSATLLLATPTDPARSAITSPEAASRTSAP